MAAPAGRRVARAHRPLVVAGLIALAAMAGACAHGEGQSQGVVGASETVLSPPDALDRVVPRLAAPETPVDAQVTLTRAIFHLKRQEGGQALAHLDALLRSPWLTEQGRANLYWWRVEAIATLPVDDELRAALRDDAFAAFLVAASLLGDDLEQTPRAREARAARHALRLQREPARFGDSPQRPVAVEDFDELEQVVAQLGCGARGRGRYHPRPLFPTARADDDTLAPRRLLCSENGDELVLWFRVDPR